MGHPHLRHSSAGPWARSVPRWATAVRSLNWYFAAELESHVILDKPLYVDRDNWMGLT